MDKQFRYSSFVVFKEDVLAQQLEQSCGPDKKELNHELSAKIIHKLGLVYKQKSPNPISLLKSAVLLNAAIKRIPKNLYFKDDLEKLCSEILKLSKAEKQDVNLVKISNQIYNEVKNMRTMLDTNLNNLVIIPDDISNDEFSFMEKFKIQEVKDMQDKVTEDFLDIIREVSKVTIETLDKPPCQFALIGMGSLARKEVTLFSDFENVIILEEGIQHEENYQEILEYFRWFSVIVLLILINFGEMIIPCAAIPSISQFGFFDVYPFGMCPDGFGLNASKNAIGCDTETLKCELIKPISEMVNCLDDKNDKDNGVHFASILAQNCFVFGDQSIYDEFKKKAEEKLQSLRLQNTDFVKQITMQFEDCNKDFGYKEKLENMMKLSMVDVKRVLYRTISMFLSLIAKSHNLTSISSFKIISELVQKGLLKAEDAQKLEFAVAISCEVRQKVYSKEKSQHDYLKMKMDDENFVGTTGATSIARCFAAMVGLQTSIEVSENGKITFSDPVHGRFNIRQQHSYFTLKHYQKALDFTNEMLAIGGLNAEDIAYNLSFIASCCFSMGCFEDSVTYYKKSLNNYEQISSDHAGILKCCNQLGLCLSLLRKFEDALIYEFKQLELLKIASPCELEDLALCYNSIAICYNALNKPAEAVEYYKCECELRLEISNTGGMEERAGLAKAYAALGACLTQDQKLKEALSYFKKELEIRNELLTVTQHFDFPTKACNLNIACCLNRLGRAIESMPYFKVGSQPLSKIQGSHSANLILDILGNRRITVNDQPRNNLLEDLDRINEWEDTSLLYQK